MARGVLEQQGGAARAQHAVGQRGHFQVRGYGLGNAAQFARGLQLGHEVAQVAVMHALNEIRLQRLSSKR